MEWLRMATLLDTEGSIQIKKLRVVGCRGPNHQLQVTVTNTDPRITNWCKAVFGGYISFRMPPKAHHRRIYRWSATTKRAEEVLRGCIPFFLIKADQARLGLAYRETVVHKKYFRAGLEDGVVEERERLRIALQDVKREEFGATDEHKQIVAQLDPRSKSFEK
jgi:hypothetical protein